MVEAGAYAANFALDTSESTRTHAHMIRDELPPLPMPQWLQSHFAELGRRIRDCEACILLLEDGIAAAERRGWHAATAIESLARLRTTLGHLEDLHAIYAQMIATLRERPPS
jgi:hypothetical protein